MKHLVVRTGVGTYTMIVDRLRKGLSKSSQVVLRADSYKDYESTLSFKPMFSRYYLVECFFSDDSAYNEFLTKLAVLKWVRLVIYTDNKKSFEDAQKIFGKFGVVFFDSYATPKSLIIKYIQMRLNKASLGRLKISEDTAKQIYRKTRFQMFMLDQSLDLLATTEVNKEDIRRLIPKYIGVSLSTFPYHFFLGKKRRECVMFLEKYSQSANTLYKPVLEFMDTWLQLYPQYADGLLSDMTVASWLRESGSEFNITEEYQVRRWLDLMQRYSFDRVITTRVILEDNKDASDYVKILTLFTILRSTVYEEFTRVLE